MTHKVCCDGCGAEEIYEPPQIAEKIHWRPVVIGSEPCIGYHLCEPCHERLKDAANPKLWPRAKQ